MYELTISGHSDDLIEIDGYISEEFIADTDSQCWILCSDGTMLKVYCDTNCNWEIYPDVSSSNTDIKRVPFKSNGGYSDIVTLVSKEPIDWVAYATNIAIRKL